MRSAIILFLLLACLLASAQRTYAPASVLASGNWYPVTISAEGVHRVDAGMLQRAGLTLPVPSSQLRLFGNGGQMLAEDNAQARVDDLRENAIWVDDGGDGQFSGSDFFLFYAPGPHRREWDPQQGRYRVTLNLYTDTATYFLLAGPSASVSGGPARVGQLPERTGGVTVNSFDEHYHYERNLVNFLSSGKEWYGEEFGSRQPSRDFDIPLRGAVPGTQAILYSDVIARSVGQPSRFEVRLNNALVQQVSLSPLPGTAYEPVATPGSVSNAIALQQADLRISFNFFPGSVNGQGWINSFAITFRRRLDMQFPGQLVFRDRASVQPGGVARFSIDNAPAATRVWDITDPAGATELTVTRSGSQLQFSQESSVVREYISFSPDRYIAASVGGRIPNQNLHAAPGVQYLIITQAAMRAEAERLGQYHRQRNGLSYLVADVEQVYREFASGSPDPTAIRDFVKMFYDRAGRDSLRRPRYLLLLGDGSYDYKGNAGNTNIIPAYQSSFSLDPLTTYTSDDYYGFLDDNEDINSATMVNQLDVGIGRVPASTPAEARGYVDKVLGYEKSFGPWRTVASFVADDEDQNTHLQDAEIVSATARGADPDINIAKIYLDMYPQESGAGGARYPQVNEAINRRIFSGNLVWNYSGHGGSRRLAQEAILEEEMVNSWANENKLPLFITATCDFAPYDNPQVKSLGENILLRPKTGGIALMTTTRLVFAFANRIINNNYLATAFTRNADGSFLSLGEAVKRAKNFTYTSVSDPLNNRKFALLGDPALTLGFPRHQVVTTAINGVPPSSFTDTIRALNRYTIMGEVRDQGGNLMSDFNGYVYPSLYDKVQQQPTRANDPGSVRVNVEQQQNLVFNGRSRVQNGRFTYTFIVPKDIDLRTGRGRLSYYADNGAVDAAGAETSFFVGGLGNEVKDDGEGPRIRAFLNDEKFVNGGVSNEHPVLIVKLRDSSGLNTVGTGIGHDMIAVLDNDPDLTYVLNDFYEAETGSYQQGSIRFPLPVLEEGPHSLKIRVWDVFNNSSEYILEFTVVKKEELSLKHVLNYPNPFTSRTRFWFEHNRPMEDLQVSVRVMTVTGKLVKTIVKTINTAGNRSDEIEWDGRDDYGTKLARGVYLYQLTVRTRDGKRQQKLEKLVIL